LDKVTFNASTFKEGMSDADFKNQWCKFQSDKDKEKAWSSLTEDQKGNLLK
jgi:hypothetical protein